MTLIGFAVLLLIAAIAGALGQALSGYSFGGCLVSIIVGWIGAYIGMWIANQFGLPEPFMIQVQGEAFPLLWSVVGAAVLSAILGLLFRGRRVY
jgi:uncharacterized membrane protein YeaQ/YmgE (transglycosylase-associated protein family)